MNLRKLIKYEEQLATNEKEDPLITLYRRDTVSSRAKLDDKAKEKEKEILGGERSPKQPSRAGDRTSSKQSYETAFSTASMKRATSEKDMAAVYRERAKANPAGCRPYGRENTGREMIEAFCEQLRLEDEKAKANPDKCRPQRRSRSSSRTKYKDGMPIDIYTDESSPCQGSTWSNRLPLPSTRPVSAASDARSKSRKKLNYTDPVALYHYYQNEWEHFREQIPGETSHSNLRRKIHNKLLDPK